ncbi:hypothetical protein HXX76_006122 [Chlamydomonas incerta]|uniref:THIF-type NAD/FAD binding fold domain-containing protein n=1 Tax=Chlamydomonas incerta TaxID=51695 RepID=A0A835W1V0_CHLIN|nr:hypothetical protein HXX76_006122 [Chlamydomonas incerta]|eukprot:KAG2437472.1 hypothetical protein HXX76_006122 [Chlamydomonas incerta]
MAPAVGSLTEAHAAVYDRQLRVWGVEVQRRLMEAKVLILGLGGLAAEVAKNLVLAGVGRVGLRDDTPAAAAAPGCFLVDPAAAAEGLSVAEACARTLQGMNPLMAVAVEPGPPHAAALLPAHHKHHGAHPPGESEAAALRALLGRYDLVVAAGGGPAGAGLPLEQVAALDGAARRLGVGVFAGAARGPSAWVFVDLGGEGGEGFGYTLKGETERRSLQYASFGGAMGAGLGAVNKRTHPLYLVLRACWHFEKEHSRPPAGAADIPAVRAAFDAIAAATPAGAAGAAASLLPADLLEAFVVDGAAPSAAASAGAAAAAASSAAAGLEDEAAAAGGLEEPQGELAPVCAVVGGVVANNVLRALSAVNPPLRNFFFYSYLVRDGLGVEECFV